MGRIYPSSLVNGLRLEHPVWTRCSATAFSSTAIARECSLGNKGNCSKKPLWVEKRGNPFDDIIVTSPDDEIILE